jgi:hypothetical protein
MIRHRLVRLVLGLVLGACAGFSFTISVLPVVLQLGRTDGQLALTRILLPLWPWSALLWAAAGLSAVRLGAPGPAAILMGIVGTASGAILVGLGPGGTLGSFALGLVSGLVYGGLGGLILGRVLGTPRHGEASS